MLDLEELYVAVGENSAASAERLMQALRSRAEMLRSFPQMGQRRPEIARAVRVLTEGLYLILYQITEGGAVREPLVQVVRVVDGRRDLSRLGL